MSVECLLRTAGGILAYVTLAVVLYGVWRGTRRPVGRTIGLSGRWLRSAWFYLASVILFFGICYIGWKPLPLTVPPQLRAWLLAVGSVLYFPGMAFVLWGRLALGRNYFVSSGFGAQLFAGHLLVMSGPFAIVRHPMYAGLILAATGSLFLYSTWTALLFACFAPFIIVRAHREETALAAEFGEEWQAYCRGVPAFVPRFRKRRE